MVKLDNLKAKTSEKLIKGLIDKKAAVQTDESMTYSNLKDCIDVHVKELSSIKKQVQSQLGTHSNKLP